MLLSVNHQQFETRNLRNRDWGNRGIGQVFSNSYDDVYHSQSSVWILYAKTIGSQINNKYTLWKINTLTIFRAKSQICLTTHWFILFICLSDSIGCKDHGVRYCILFTFMLKKVPGIWYMEKANYLELGYVFL